MTEKIKIIEKQEDIEKCLKKTPENFYDFRGITFRCKIDFSGKEFNHVNFEGAIFEKEAIFINTIFTKTNTTFSKVNFYDNVEFLKSTFGSSVNFEGSTFYKNCNFSEITAKKRINLNSTTFHGQCSFINSKFIGKSLFNSTTFNSSITFQLAKFDAAAEFNGCTFRKNVDFNLCSFQHEAIFKNANFLGKTTFKEAKFKFASIFYTAIFENETNFVSTEFQRATFNRAKFIGDVFFDHAKFSGDALFDKTEITGRLQFKRTEFQEFSYFRNIVIGSGMLNFESALFSGLLNLSKSHFVNINFTNVIFKNLVNFTNCKFENAELTGAIFKEVGLFKNFLIASSNRESFRIVKHELLKINNKIDALSYHEKEMEAYRLELKELSWKKTYSEKFILFMNRVSNGYGLDWVRGVGFTFVVALLFFIPYLLCLKNPYFDWGWEGWPAFWEVLGKTTKYYIQFFFAGHKFNFMEQFEPGGFAYILDMVGRIFITYGYYQTIQAFRKYGRW